MNYCQSCGLLISGEQYNYCPNCGQVIRSFEIICPLRVYAGVPFKLQISSQGSQAVNIEQILLGGAEIASSQTLDAGSDIILECKLDSIGYYDLKVSAGGRESLLSVSVEERGALELRWQNYQTISENPRSNLAIVVSRTIANKYVSLGQRSGWLRAKKIRFRHSGKPFEFSKHGDMFLISESFFDLLQKLSEAQVDVEIDSEDNHCFSIPGVNFRYDETLPRLVVSHEDYLNTNPLRGDQGEISYKISYQWGEQDGDRPIDSLLLIQRGANQLQTQSREFFNDQQCIYKSIQVDLRNIPPGISNLEIEAQFEIENNSFSMIHQISFVKVDHIPLEPDPARVIAIDFGTSNTCLAYVNPHTNEKKLFDYHVGIAGEQAFNPTVMKFIQFNDNPPHSVTYCHLPGDNDLPLTYATNFKPRLERDEELYFSDIQNTPRIRPLSPKSLSRMFLREILDRFAMTKNYLPGTILLSYPASFSELTRSKLLGSVDMPGVKVLQNGVLSEPENIALYFAQNNDKILKKLEDDKEVSICVFDCGGGTTDISVVRITSGACVRFEILATWGTDEFSGNFLNFLIGRVSDGGKDWFPKSIKDIYASSNEDLKEYLKRSVGYEEIKKSDSFSIPGETYKSEREVIGTEIDSIYNKIKYDLLFKLFQLKIIEKPETDYLILAGNSCQLELFYERAREAFDTAKIIWRPSEGKKAVVLGALLAYETIAGLDIRGKVLSRNGYYIRLGLKSLITVFRPLLDMREGAEYTSPPVRPVGIPILGKPFISDKDSEPVITFIIPPPPELVKGAIYCFKLQFREKEICYAWAWQLHEDEHIMDYNPIYKEP